MWPGGVYGAGHAEGFQACVPSRHIVRGSNACSRAIQWPTKETIYNCASQHVIFVVYYLNNILIFSKTLVEYWKYIRVVLDILYQYKLSVNKEKSEFYIIKIVFLGYEISPSQIYIEPSKVEAIKNQLIPINIIEVQGFIGFINFYRIFIKGYSNIA